MGWISWTVLALALCIAALWFKQHYLDVAPPMPAVNDYVVISDVQFVDQGTHQQLVLSAIKSGMKGSLAVKPSENGFALALTMNSAGAMFPITEPTEVKAGQFTTLQALSQGAPYFISVMSVDKAERMVGGGTYQAVTVTRSRASVETYIKWYQTYGVSWHWEQLPLHKRVFLAEGGEKDLK